MRAAKWILLIILCTAAGGYAVINQTYRAVEQQQMQQRSLHGKIDRVLSIPVNFSNKVLSGLPQSYRSLLSPNEDSTTGHQSIKYRKEELTGWLIILRWILFSVAGLLLGIAWYPKSNEPLLTWMCAVVFLVLGITTPFLSIVVESATLPVPILKEMDSVVFYHKAKSVAGVMYALIKTSRAYEFILGILIGLFSVVAPLVKLCILPLLPASGIKKRLQPLLFRFAWVDVLSVSIIVSFLATDQLLGASASNSFLFTGHSQLEDGAIFFLLYLVFTAVGSTYSE